MKKNLLLCTLLFVGFSSNAQFKGHLKEVMETRPDADVIASILKKQQSRKDVARKTTAPMRRLQASAYKSYGELQDSVMYMYSNGRGSEHSYLTSYVNYYSPVGFDVEQNIKCDSSAHRHYVSGTEYLSEYGYTYDNQNRNIEYKSVLNQNYTYGYKLVYDSKNRVERVTTMDYNSSTPSATAEMYITYDNNDQRVEDSTHSITLNRPSRKRLFTYDGSGNRTSYSFYQYDTTTKVLAINFTVTYTYDNQNRLIKTVTEGDYGSGWLKQSMDTFAYSGNNTQYEYYSTAAWDNGNNSWIPEDLTVYLLNNNGDIESYILQEWGNNKWDTLELNKCTYHNDRLLHTIKGHLYTSSGFNANPYDSTRYYYEEYYPVGINQTTNDVVNVSIYPNPASEVIRLSAPVGTIGTIHIVNASGQTMLQQAEEDLNSAAIDISNFATGVYTLYIQSAVGQRISQKQFMKL